MQDREIVEMLFARDERALALAQKQYDSYCRVIAMRILRCSEDVDECVNDTWRQLWEAIPPHRPEHLASNVKESVVDVNGVPTTITEPGDKLILTLTVSAEIGAYLSENRELLLDSLEQTMCAYTKADEYQLIIE